VTLFLLRVFLNKEETRRNQSHRFAHIVLFALYLLASASLIKIARKSISHYVTLRCIGETFDNKYKIVTTLRGKDLRTSRILQAS